VHADGTTEVHDVPAVPVGMFPDSEYEDTVIQLQAGDRLYLHSDGLYEERHSETREEFGRTRMQQELSAAANTPFVVSLDKLLQSVTEWHGDEALSDDVAVMGLAIKG
jgi:sigma-B regulation protein RsbU (phosphoserine phosphatase)